MKSYIAAVVVLLTGLSLIGCTDKPAGNGNETQTEKEFISKIIRARIAYLQHIKAAPEELGFTVKTDPEGATCTAECSSGDITCSGPNCGANDGVACSAWDAAGNTIESKKCLTSSSSQGANDPKSIESLLPEIFDYYGKYLEQRGALAETFGFTLVVDPNEGTCSAKCQGATVTCEGASCSALDGLGCTSNGQNGDLLQIKQCITTEPPSSDPIA